MCSYRAGDTSRGFPQGAHGLAALAAKVLGEDPFSSALVVFRAKRVDWIKILVWDGSGLVLVWKQRIHPADAALPS
jgi:transposase